MWKGIVGTFIIVALLATGCSSTRRGDNYYRHGRLKTVEEMGGYKVTGWVWIYDSGTLKQFENVEPLPINDGTIPPHSTVFLREDGSIRNVYLSKDTMIQGMSCNGGWGKISTGFHENGQLSHCFITEDAVIQGVPCKSTLFYSVSFHPDGTLTGCRVSKDCVINGISYSQGDDIAF